MTAHRMSISHEAAVKEVKKKIGNNFTAQQMLIKEAAERMFEESTKGQDIKNLQITLEQVTVAFFGSVVVMDSADLAALENFEQALTSFTKSTLEQAVA